MLSRAYRYLSICFLTGCFLNLVAVIAYSAHLVSVQRGFLLYALLWGIYTLIRWYLLYRSIKNV